MNISIKTPEEIEKIRVASQLAAEVLVLLREHVKPGVTTGELNEIAHKHITEVQGGTPATLGYHGFPASICTSLNHQVCHGIPADKTLRDGDILNIDVTVIKDGWHGDTSAMYTVGKPSVRAQRLIDVTYEAHWLAHGDQVKLGEVTLEVVHVPGHRPEQISLLVTDTSRGAQPWCLLTADFILVGDVSRPDLAQSGEEGAAQIYDVALQNVKDLPDFVEVYPGHVAGST